MSIQDKPFSSPPDLSTGSERTFGDVQSGLDKSSTSGLRDDLKSATETAKSDLGRAAEVAKQDFAALKDQVASEFSNLKSQAGGDLSALKGQATDQLQTLKAQAQDQLGQATEKAKSYATEQVSELTDRARLFATDKKASAAQQLNGVVDAVSRVADDLRNHEQGKVVAPYADSIVGGLRQLADTVENRSVDDLVGMVRDFGRRQPVAFLSVAAIAGFAASRFLMASARRASDASSQGIEDRDMQGMYGSDFDETGLGAAGATEFGGAGTLDVAVDDDRTTPARTASTGTGVSDNGRI